MPPPKVKLHKNTGKQKSIPKLPPNRSTSGTQVSEITTNHMPQAGPTEPDRQFELELYWCIQQLENSLNTPHIRENNKKLEDITKLINILKSPSQPLIKKRQIMRTNLGDYRTKMAEEEKTLALNPESVGFDAPKKKAKYHFVKKAAILNGSNDFRFNFSNIQITDDIVETKAEVNTQSEVSVCKPCIVGSTANSFRFNFTIEE
ncbi:UPF0488 protein CG14286 [Malaya genurostris]|uniref:UPF0488 protein CG14286 n=1 Tax=Malaya genurostris TaxID=325434 RepID=UPI0026F3CE11|nr:UPF0488 protein CG14286 [Malaya genurostris]